MNSAAFNSNRYWMDRTMAAAFVNTNHYLMDSSKKKHYIFFIYFFNFDRPFMHVFKLIKIQKKKTVILINKMKRQPSDCYIPLFKMKISNYNSTLTDQTINFD